MRVIFRRAYIVRHARANIAIISQPGHVPMKLRNLQTDEMQRRMRRPGVFQRSRVLAFGVGPPERETSKWPWARLDGESPRPK